MVLVSCQANEMHTSAIAPSSGSRLSRIAWISVSSAVVFNIAACSGQKRSEAPVSTATEVAHAESPLRRLNSNPLKAYEIRMRLANIPGPLGEVDGVAQFDVQNPGECATIEPFIGAIPRISSNEHFTLTRISDVEYVGMVYADQMFDEDYYGRGVCRWALAEARVVFKASEGAADTRFVYGLSAELVRAQGTQIRYFWSGFYPRAKMDAFRDFGVADLDKVPADKRGEFFSVTLSAQQVGQ